MSPDGSHVCELPACPPGPRQHEVAEWDRPHLPSDQHGPAAWSQQAGPECQQSHTQRPPEGHCQSPCGDLDQQPTGSVGTREVGTQALTPRGPPPSSIWERPAPERGSHHPWGSPPGRCGPSESRPLWNWQELRSDGVQPQRAHVTQNSRTAQGQAQLHPGAQTTQPGCRDPSLQPSALFLGGSPHDGSGEPPASSCSYAPGIASALTRPVVPRPPRNQPLGGGWRRLIGREQVLGGHPGCR